METKERLMLKYALGGIVLSTSLHSAALSLGASSGQAIIGRPLDISVRSSAPLADIESAGCLLAEVRYGDNVLPAGNVSLSVQAVGEGAVIRVRSSVPVNEPVVSVMLQTGCAADRFSRKYTLLADLDPALAPSPSVAALPLVVMPPPVEAAVPVLPAPAAVPAYAPATLPRAAEAASTTPSPARATAPVAPAVPAALSPAPRPAASAPPRPRPTPRAPAPPKAVADAPARKPVAAADKKVAADPASPKAASPAAAPAPVAAGPRLKLDPVDLSPGRNPGLKLNTELTSPPTGNEANRQAASALWAALNTPPEKAAEDARRLATMEAELKALREQQAGLQASMATLTAQMQAERDERAPKSLLYALAAALALAGAALAWLLAERRRQRVAQTPSDLPWWQSVQEADSGSSLPGVAPAAAAAEVPAAAVLPQHGGDNILAAVQVSEATESSFAQTTDDAPVSVDALLDLVQQVEFFESLQQRAEVTMVLEQFVEQHPSSCELPYLLMLQQAHVQGDAERLRELGRRFELAFGAPAPDASCYTAGSAGLEAQSKFMDVLTRFWPEDQVLGLLRNTLFAPPGTGLLEKHSLQAFEDALLLYSVAHTLQADTTLRAPPAWPEAAVPSVVPAPSQGLAMSAPLVSAAAQAAPSEPTAPAGGLDIDLSFTTEHDIPPPAEAPVAVADAPDSRDLPMLDFDLFAIDDGKDGKPPAKP